MEATAQNVQRGNSEVVREGELNRTRQSLVNLARSTPELDSIPNEELGSKIRVPNENFEEVREYVNKFLERVGELYHEATQRSGEGGLSLSQFEAMLQETHSEPEVALGSYAFVQYIRGEQLVQPQEQLVEAKTVLREALDAPWTKRFGMAHEVDSVYRLLIKEMKRQANEIQELEKIEIQVREDRLGETERYRIELEHQRQQFLLDTDRIRTQYEIRKEKLVDDRLAELKAQELLQQEKEQELLNQRQELLKQYKIKLFDRIVNLETKERWDIMRSICRETRYSIGWENIQHLVEAELKEGDNLEDFPAEPRRNKGEYKEQFLKRYFGTLLTRRLSNVELDKDRAMMGAFDILYNSLTEGEELPDVESVTLGDWHNVLGQTEDGIEGLVTTYEMAELEDTTLRDEINKLLEREDNNKNETFYINKSKRADLISRTIFGGKWDLDLPTITEKNGFDNYLKQVRDKIKSKTSLQKELPIFEPGKILIVNGKNSLNVSDGVYIIYSSKDDSDFRVFNLATSNYFYLKSPNDKYISNPVYLREKFSSEDGLNFVKIDDVYKNPSVYLEGDFSDEKSLTNDIKIYHPYFKQEFQARLLYDKAMKTRFERLLEDEKKG